ncbi:hypothetical protein BH11PSE2_BH11PSE2_16750 [soil metagenome]
MSRPDDDAAKPRKSENDNMKPGSPPRPATEPDGAAGSVQNSETLTDPGSGEPNPRR